MTNEYRVNMYKIENNDYVISKSYCFPLLEIAEVKATELRNYWGEEYPLISVKLPDGTTYSDYEL